MLKVDILVHRRPDFIYPDSNHGSQFQYPELFVQHVTQFLKG